MSYPYYKTKLYDNFYEMFKSLYEDYPNRVAVKFFEKDKIVSIKYKELIQEISNIYKYFQNSNIKNKHIAIISENRYEYITIYLATIFNNVIVPLDKELDNEALNKCVNKFDIDVIFYTNKTEEKINGISNKKIKKINIDEKYTTINKSEYNVSQFMEVIKNVNKDDFCVLASTSGTDGEMKGVMLSQYNIIINLRGSLENNILKNPTLSILPMNHTYGFNPGVLASFYNATTVCINRDLKYIVRDLKKFNPYFFGAVPMVIEGIYNNIIREAKRKNKYELLMKMIEVSNFLLKYNIDARHLFFGNIINKRLRLIVSGGAMLNPIYVEKFDELGIKVLNGYGLTECAPIIAVNRECNNIVGSVGTILNHVDVKVADDGEILVKGPNVMLGYYKEEELTKSVIENGYFKTGDLGYVKDNIVFITGRKKNLIILGNGKNFSPEVIEQKLLELPYIKECIVTSKNNEFVIAKIYMEEQTKTLEEDIKKINEKLPKYMNIDDYEIMSEEFEKNSTKKIRRKNYVK